MHKMHLVNFYLTEFPEVLMALNKGTFETFKNLEICNLSILQKLDLLTKI